MNKIASVYTDCQKYLEKMASFAPYPEEHREPRPSIPDWFKHDPNPYVLDPDHPNYYLGKGGFYRTVGKGYEVIRDKISGNKPKSLAN